MALGAFIAGVLLAESEFRHALEAYIEPLKGLLLGLFFIAVGMSVNFGLLTTEVGMVLGLVIALVAIKALVLYVLGQISGLDYGSRQSLAISISQGGEFAFVILGIAVGAGGLARELADLVIMVVTLSMAVTPFLMRYSWAASNCRCNASSLSRGNSLSTYSMAASRRMPVAWPWESLSITPPMGSGVMASMPASSNAVELATAECPSWRLSRIG